MFIDYFINNILNHLYSLICIYLDLNLEEYTSGKKNNNTNYNNNINNTANDIENINDKIKEGYLYIGGKNISIAIEANKNLYLEEPKKEKIYIFKKIRLNNNMEGVYVKIKNDAYENMLAITDWIYPEPEQIFGYIYTIKTYIGLFLIFCSIPFKYIANNEKMYISLKKFLEKEYLNVPEISNKNIFLIYGDFEIALVIIRFVIFIIAFLFFTLLLFKRVFYGGYVIFKLIKISNILCYSFIWLNIIIFILNFLLSIFAFLCDFVDFQLKYVYKNYEDHTNVFYIQAFFTVLSLGCIIFIIVNINQLRKDLLQIANDLDNLHTIKKNEEKEIELKYIGLDSKYYTLNEIQIEDHPRYLYYNLKLNEQNEEGLTVYNRNAIIEDNIDVISEIRINN